VNQRKEMIMPDPIDPELVAIMQTGEPPTPEPPVEPPTPEPPAPPVTPPAAPEPPATPPVEPPTPEPPVRNYETENALLRDQLNELAKKMAAAPVIEPPPTPAPTPAPPPVAPPAAGEDVAFMTDEEADQLIDNPKILNKILNKVFQAGREAALREVPSIASSVAQQQLTMKERADAFWDNNKDLKSFKDFTALVANQVQTEHQDWTLDQIFEETAKVARTRLGIVSAATPPGGGQHNDPPAPGTGPALPGKAPGGARREPNPQLTDSQKQEMHDILTVS
jgi:hypothetical protein